MKTEISFRHSSYVLRVADAPQQPLAKPALQLVPPLKKAKQRFATIENQSVQNPQNWDEAWFANYE